MEQNKGARGERKTLFVRHFVQRLTPF